MIDLSQSQCKNLADFIEFNIFEFVRKNEDVDNVDWLADMMDAYKKLVKGFKESKE